MARGTIAKQNISAKIKQLFGKDYVGESANKHYILADDGGEKVQIAISLTCPKVPLGEVNVNTGGGIDFTANPVIAPTKFEPAEITEEEENNIKELMQRLGL